MRVGGRGEGCEAVGLVVYKTITQATNYHKYKIRLMKMQ